MTITAEIIFEGTSQTLVLDDEEGRPSAVGTVSVWPAYADDTQTAEVATTGSATIETNPNTTLSAAAGPSEPDPTLLTVTSGTGFTIGRRYLLTEDSTGVSEQFEVAGVNGTAVTATRPLINSYTAGAAVVSTRVIIAVSDSWAADVANLSDVDGPNNTYRVRWPVTIGGVVKIRERGFDLVRYPTASGVTPLDVDDIYPGWIDRLPPNHQVDQGRSLIRRASTAVRFELYGDNKAQRSLRNPEHRARLVIVRANLELQRDIRARGGDNEGAFTLATDDWRQIYDQTIRAPVAAVDTAGGGASAPVRPLPLTVR